MQLPSPALSADGLEGQEAAAVAEHVESQLRVAVEAARVLEAPLPLGALASQIYTMVGSGAPAYLPRILPPCLAGIMSTRWLYNGWPRRWLR